MREPRTAEERLAVLQLEIGEAFDAGRIDAVTELLSGAADLHDADEPELAGHGVPDYRRQLDDTRERLRREGMGQGDREDIGRRLGLLCFVQLVLASMVSRGDLLTPELIDTAVTAGYRDVAWGLTAARQLTDPQERVYALLVLLSRLPAGPQRLRIYDNILKQRLAEIAWRAEQYRATERLVEALPGNLLPELLPELRELAAGFTHDHVGARPRALAAIASRAEEPDKSKIIAEALEAARRRPDTWGHAMTVMAVLPQVPPAEKPALSREFVHAVTESLRPGDEGQFEDLTRLADVDEIGPRYLITLITAATSTERYQAGRLDPDQRDRLLTDYAERLARRHRTVEAFQVVRAVPGSQARFAATWLVLQALDRWLLFAALTLPEPSRTRWQVLRRLAAAGLLRTGPGGRRRLRQRLLSQALTLDGDGRTDMLWSLLPYLPEDLADQVKTELGRVLAAAETADRGERQLVITGLTNLAGVSRGPDQEALLSRAFALAAIGDDDERRALAADIHWLLRREQPPDRASLLKTLAHAADNGTEPDLDFARLPDELLPLAWETPWARRPRHFREFSVLASRMAARGQADAIHGRLAALIGSLRPDELAGLLESLPADLITAKLAACLIERWAQADPTDQTGEAEEHFAKILSALVRAPRQLSDDVVRLVVEWDRSARPQRHWPGYSSDNIAACLAPLAAQAGYLAEAQAMAAAIAADHEKARALAGIARHLPDQDRLATAREALTLARSAGSERVQTEYLRQFTEGLMKLAGATRIEDIVADTPDARALAAIAALLPPGEAAGIWEEAITLMSGSEILDFIRTMPEPIARDAIAAIVHRSATDHREYETPVIRALFARIGEDSPAAQFGHLIDFVEAAAHHGRPALLRQMGVVAPFLFELGGDIAVNGLRQAVYRAATWWP